MSVMRVITVLTVALICSRMFAAEYERNAPKRAALVVVPSPYDSFLVHMGNVKVTFRDGHSELWTHEGNCRDVKMSPKGSVGWIRVDKKSVDVQRMDVVGKDTLVVRLPDGTVHKFSPFDENVSIVEFRFVDADRAIAVRSMGHHGPSSFVKYNIATGAIVDWRGTNYTPYNLLPEWAKSLVADRSNY